MNRPARLAAAAAVLTLLATASCGTTTSTSSAVDPPAPMSSIIPSTTPSVAPSKTPAQRPSTPPPSSNHSASSAPSQSTAPVRPTDLVADEDFRKLEQKANGTIGLALVQLDRDGTPAGSVRVGSWQTGPAWSTMKIPLAMAALSERGDASTRTAVRQAVTASDNAAAQQLWQGLGPAEVAGPQVEHQLVLRGDRTTQVQQKVTRSGFSAFGQTLWALEDQASFAARLVCSPRPSAVLHDMRRVTASQRWGLGRIPGAAIKGGWGPLRSGSGYTARQLAVMQTDEGSTWGIAISSESDAGFQAAVQDLDRTSAWLSRQFDGQQLSISTTELRTRDCSQ